MRPSSLLTSGLILAAASFPARTARAGDSEYPVAFTQRPLTLPRLTLAPQIEADVDVASVGFNGQTYGQVLAGMQVGASFGVTPDVEVGAVVLPVQFYSPAAYGGVFVGKEGDLAQPTLFATVRFLHAGAVEMGARLALQVVVPHPTLGLVAGAVFEPGVPLVVHLGTIARLDAAVGARIAVAGPTVTSSPGTQLAGGFDVPLALAFDVVEPLHVGLSTGVHVGNFSAPGATARIPLGVFAGYAIGQKRPIVDVDPFFSFYDFVTPGGGILGDRVNPGVFVAGVSMRGYVYR